MKKSNNLVRLIAILIFSLSCIICFCYYSVNFYDIIIINKETIRWSIFGLLILFSMILGMVNFIKISKLQNENYQLKELIVELGSNSDSHYYSILEHIQNSREISLDVLDELKEKL